MARDSKKQWEQSKNAKNEPQTGPIDIPRSPGEDRPPTSDELPIGEQASVDRDDEERPSRSGKHEVDADRRRSREPYSGVERRTR